MVRSASDPGASDRMPFDELRHTLSDARAATEALDRRLDGDRDAATGALLAHVRRALRRVEEVTDAVIAYERAAQPLERATVDLTVVARSAAALVAAEAPDARVDVGDLPQVDGDGTLLYGLFRILFDNAVTYAHPGRRLHVTVDARREGSAWRISVADNGRGIDPSLHDVVFDLYEQRVGARAPGQGVGLAAARRILQAHGGRIWVDPTRDDGATIHLTLPAAATARPGQQRPRDTTPAPT